MTLSITTCKEVDKVDGLQSDEEWEEEPTLRQMTPLNSSLKCPSAVSTFFDTHPSQKGFTNALSAPRITSKKHSKINIHSRDTLSSTTRDNSVKSSPVLSAVKNSLDRTKWKTIWRPPTIVTFRRTLFILRMRIWWCRAWRGNYQQGLRWRPWALLWDPLRRILHPTPRRFSFPNIYVLTWFLHEYYSY